MDIAAIHPELRNAYRRTPSLPCYSDLFVSVANLLLRLRRNKKSISSVEIREHNADGASVRVYTPPAPHTGAALLWIHGGGLLIGRASMNDALCAKYAKDLNILVVSVNYRLADKHPFPAAIDDCFYAWRWLQKNAVGLGVEPDRIIISGQSAGAGLAASLVQRIVDSGDIQPAGQALFCPMLDDRTAAREELDSVGHRVWNNRSNRAGWTAYLGQSAGQSATPEYAVPGRRENLTGLPPSWIGIGDVDLFYVESKSYANRLQACGVACELHTVQGAPHGFESLVPEASVTKSFFESNYGFLRKKLGL